mgnify:CR=1 FL=1
MNEHVDGRMDKYMDGWTDGRTDGRTDLSSVLLVQQKETNMSVIINLFQTNRKLINQQSEFTEC